MADVLSKQNGKTVYLDVNPLSNTPASVTLQVDVDTNQTINLTSISQVSTGATSSNKPSTIVKRDANGDFAAGTITATLNGAANSAAAVTGTIGIANGGTGQTTQQAAINALTGTQSAGKFLRSDGVNATLASIQAVDVPVLNQNTTGTASNVTGTVAIANGGTGQVTANDALNALLPSQTGNSGKFLKTDGTNTSWASGSGIYTAPTVQKFTSGTGTYTTPTSPSTPLYLRVRMVGGGGGGGGNGTSGQTGGGAGGNTSFGSFTAGGGSGGGSSSGTGAGIPGAGGTVSGVGTPLMGFSGSPGFWSAIVTSSGPSSNEPGGAGGSSVFGGSGIANYDSAGSAAAANTGSGGSGAGGKASTVYPGGGGGAGAYIETIITPPSATYSYTVGTAGTAGGLGTSGFAGGAGAAGIIIIEEFYQ